jgi:hypothetical protein
MYSARHGTPVTPADGAAVRFRGLYIGGTGDLIVTMVGDSAPVTFKSVPTGAVLWINVIEIKTATTATNIVGLN